jgi:hypothetical protein
MDYSNKDERRHFVDGFFFAFNVMKAMGEDIDLRKLVPTLKEIAERETTIALTPTDHLLAAEKAMGKPLTEKQKAFYLSMLAPQAKQDETNREAAELLLKIFRDGDWGTVLD